MKSPGSEYPRGRAPSSVLLVGPASPRDLADLLSGRDRDRALAIAGYRGIPVSELARSLVGAGLEVEVATTAEDVEVPVALAGDRIRLSVGPMRQRARDRALDGFRRERQWLTRAIDASSADVVHAHWTYEFAWAALGSPRPVVVTAHDAPLTVLRHYRDSYRAIRTAMAYAVRFRIRTLTAVSPYLAERWRREMMYRRPIAVVPNSAPQLAASSRSRSYQTAPRIVEVADAGRRKNVASLVRAFRLLRDADPTIELDLVGSGLGSEDPLPAALAREGSCQGIHFLGSLDRSALAETLSRAHIFVHPSLEECCSTAVLEAMRVGLPVVAGRRAGGTPWMLSHGRAGMLTDVEDPAAIARSVSTLLKDGHLAQELSARASERVSGCFSAGAVLAAYLDVYEAVLANRS